MSNTTNMLAYSTVSRSIKRYFLLDQGDFFTHFMDTALEELQKPVGGILPKNLLYIKMTLKTYQKID